MSKSQVKFSKVNSNTSLKMPIQKEKQSPSHENEENFKSNEKKKVYIYKILYPRELPYLKCNHHLTNAGLHRSYSPKNRLKFLSTPRKVI